MKTLILPLLLLLTALLTVVAQAQTRSPRSGPAAATPLTTSTPATTVYVSDTLDLPLRAGASDRYKIIGGVPSGSPVEVLKVDAAKGYSLIRTPKGIKGWLLSNQLTEIPSGRELLAKVRQELEQLQARYGELKQHMDDMVSRPDGENLSYPQLYEQALRCRQQLAEYRKVAADTVAMDDRNKALQEQTVTLERDLRVVQQENQALRDANGSMKLLLGAVLAGSLLLAVMLIPRIREQQRAQWRRL